MIQEDRELLIRDLCTRLPYGVLCHINNDDTNTPRKLIRIEVDEIDGNLLDFWTDIPAFKPIQVYLSEVKPYLRPLSSMTEEERKEYLHECDKDDKDALTTPRHHGIDWLNANHFDYRGLIHKGLAIEAFEGMYD